jgi:hypothetical protein
MYKLRIVFQGTLAAGLAFCTLAIPTAQADPPPLKVIKLQPQANVKPAGLQPEILRQLKRIIDDRTDVMSDRQDFETLTEMGGRAVPALGSILRDTDIGFGERWVAARALGRIGGSEARGHLVDTLENDRFSMARLAAIRGIRDLRDRSTVPIIAKYLEDDAMVVRSAAADALGELRDISAAPALLKALDREDNFYKGRSLWVRQHIVAALGEVQSRNAVPRLVQLLDDEDPRVGLAAIQSLGKITRLTFRVPGADTSIEYTRAAAPKWKAWWEENKSDYL